nr:endonuclease domain-containing protein [Luteimonas sp. FCS-9]
MRPGAKRDAARRLRRDMTRAERALWRHLRMRQVEGARFRRQHPVGPYVVDFVCLARRLVIEVDGGQHAGSASDAMRDAFLRMRGYRLLRFWNHDVLGNPEGVCLRVRQALCADALAGQSRTDHR